MGTSPTKRRVVGETENVACHHSSYRNIPTLWLISALCFVVFGLAIASQVARAADNQASADLTPKPYRVLLVVDHGNDPYGVVVNNENDIFQPAAALLKAWSIPFDIFRLDQQNLDASYLFRRSGKIRYGAVIWVADPSSYGTQNFVPLLEAVRAGTGLIAIDSRFLDSALNQLLGLKFKEVYTSTEPFHLTSKHSIVRDIGEGRNAAPSQTHEYGNRLWVQPTTGSVLVAQGRHPVVTLNQPWPGSYAIWLQPSTLSMLSNSGFWRSIFFRSLVSSIGYVVTPNVDYSHRVIFELDDWGTADKGFLSYWHYLEPNAETIQQDLVGPLQQHHGVASVEVNTGYVDRKSRRIVSPWIQKFTDSYGLHQDYVSTHEGLKEAADKGVLEIESHGWTHMEPDLESPPGPWWTADLEGEGSAGGWYVEFEDQRRGKEIPAATQIYHMEHSLAALQQDFGKRALELKPGGNAWSKSQFNNTAGLATRVGFGLFHGDQNTYYLDRELALDMANVVPDFNTGYDTIHNLHPERWPDHPAGPVILGFHDRDIALDHNFINQLFAALPDGYKTIGTNQYIGILHTRITSSGGSDAMRLTFAQDSHYCAYFANHSSSWRLWMSDDLRRQFAAPDLQISIDNQLAHPTRAASLREEFLTIDVPSGVGNHTWELRPIQSNK